MQKQYLEVKLLRLPNRPRGVIDYPARRIVVINPYIRDIPPQSLHGEIGQPFTVQGWRVI